MKLSIAQIYMNVSQVGLWGGFTLATNTYIYVILPTLFIFVFNCKPTFYNYSLPNCRRGNLSEVFSDMLHDL